MSNRRCMIVSPHSSEEVAFFDFDALDLPPGEAENQYFVGARVLQGVIDADPLWAEQVRIVGTDLVMMVDELGTYRPMPRVNWRASRLYFAPTNIYGHAVIMHVRDAGGGEETLHDLTPEQVAFLENVFAA